MTTKQEIFDKVATHLLRQGARSVDDFGDCMYRGEFGRMCAVGCLIPDQCYSTKIEMQIVQPVAELRDEKNDNARAMADALECAGIADDALIPLLRDLQRLHDNADVDEWEAELSEVAENHRLTFSGNSQDAATAQINKES